MAFPAPYPLLLRDDPAMDGALRGALADTDARHPGLLAGIALDIFWIGFRGGVNFRFRHAGLRTQDTHYSASLLKVAAMYSAFELRRTCARIAAAGSGPPARLWVELRQILDPQIESAVPALRVPGLPPAQRLPKYERIFTARKRPAGGLSLAFTRQFGDWLWKMIAHASNEAASKCIASLGYSWINGALRAGGFFVPPATGIWLAGTYAGALPAVRIPTVGGGGAAQATTCFHMANLIGHAVRGTLVDRPSSRDMLDLLAAAATNAASWIDPDRRKLPPRSYKVSHSKIGIGPATKQRAVLSEATLLTHSSGHRFGIVWQNVAAKRRRPAAVSMFIERIADRFAVTAPPPPRAAGSSSEQELFLVPQSASAY